jgi:hypothetical protein
LWDERNYLKICDHYFFSPSSFFSSPLSFFLVSVRFIACSWAAITSALNFELSLAISFLRLRSLIFFFSFFSFGGFFSYSSYSSWSNSLWSVFNFSTRSSFFLASTCCNCLFKL